MGKKFRLGVLASGGGSNFEAIVKRSLEGYIKSKVVVLIVNNKDAYAIERAKKYNIPYHYISSKTEGSHEKAMEKITKVLKDYNVDLVILAGYMKKILPPLLTEYKNRILNIHPALLPKYGGKGYYGLNVHKKVLENNEKETGPTVHLVDEIYDHGKILGQYKLNIIPGLTPEELQQRVLELEHLLYSRVIKDIEEGYIILDE